MSIISVYTFGDADGHESGGYTTQSFAEAQRHAARYKLRVIDNVYEWAEAIPVEGADYTDGGDDGEYLPPVCGGCLKDIPPAEVDENDEYCRECRDMANRDDDFERRHAAAEAETYRLANP